MPPNIPFDTSKYNYSDEEGFTPRKPVIASIPTDLPWDDCKVAFGFVCDPDDVWKAYGLGGNATHRLPEGWRLRETDGAGARWVAVFRVEGAVSNTDGAVVRALLDELAYRRTK